MFILADPFTTKQLENDREVITKKQKTKTKTKKKKQTKKQKTKKQKQKNVTTSIVF